MAAFKERVGELAEERDHSPRLPLRSAERLYWYNPDMDDEDDYSKQGGPLLQPTTEPANLLSSLCTDGFHRPALDIDIPMVVTPSRTEGHFHVTFPELAMSWTDYCNLLDALATAGIVEHSYVQHSKRRGQTLLRVPEVPF